MDEIFITMDFTQTGKIDFNEFKTFYDVILTATNQSRSVNPESVDTNPPSVAPDLPTVAETPEEEEDRGERKTDGSGGGVILRCCNLC